MEKTPNRKRTALNGSKIALNVILAIAISAALILTSFFLFDGVNISAQNKDFWIQKALSAITTFLLMLSISNTTEIIAGQKDNDLSERLIALDGHYQKIMQNCETADLERFLENINKANKYKAYLAKIKKKLRKCKDADKIKELNEKLIISPEELWQSTIKVKYHKVTYNQMISGAFDVSENDSEYDLNTHKAKYGAQKFLWKIIALVTGGGIVADFAFSTIGFTKDMILPLIYKVITILVSVYSGVCFGMSINERTKTVLKSKLRIFSQFRKRMDGRIGVADLSVEIEPDIVVERAKADINKNPLRRTYDNTFGAGRPVKIGGFASALIQNTIDYASEKNEHS